MLVVLNLGLLLLSLCLVHECDLNFLVELHLLSHLFFSLILHIATTLVDDVTSFFASLLDFFECAAFFLLQEIYAIGQKAQVVLSSLASQFGCNEFLVQSGIIILFIRS